MAQHAETVSFFDQPRAVWATGFACVVGFMSIGLVDPILTSIAAGLQATPTQVSLLFTSYFLVTSLMMLVTGFVSSRLGGRRTLILGAALIVVFSALAGTSNSVFELVLFRGGWGLGNAFFVVTALAVLVASSRHGVSSAVLVYEAAMGLGLSAGPLVGAALGVHSWRYPFFGTATLMAIGLLAVAMFLPPQPKPAVKTSLIAPLRALGHPGLFAVSAAAFFYYYAFFTVLAFVPFVLQMSAHAVGLIFFGWGVLLAAFSVIVTPRLQARFGALPVAGASLVVLAILLIVMGVGAKLTIAGCVMASGAVMGVCNTIFTEMAMEVSDAPRPVASAGYNFLRWFAGVVAPFVAPTLAEHFGPLSAFVVAAAAALVAPLILLARRSALRIEGRVVAEASAPAMTAAQPLVVAAVDGSASDEAVIERAIAIAAAAQGRVAVAHVQVLEVAGEDAADDETAEQSAAIVTRSLRAVEEAGLPAASMRIEAPEGLAAKAVVERALALGARTLVVGAPHGDAGDRVHGSFARAAQRVPHGGLEVVVARQEPAENATL
ncbi:MAG: MFS transporter [Roseiarcus sp.]|uniref:MFS transporter n=1 Tax=Roseiarcus sp. TaxID=1969460 RepID=UPI003C1EC8CB